MMVYGRETGHLSPTDVLSITHGGNTAVRSLLICPAAPAIPGLNMTKRLPSVGT